MFKDQQLLKILPLPKIQRYSKKSVSIFQSRQNIADLQSSFNDENYANTSLLLSTNRQINSGMILDMKQYDESSKMKKHFIFKDGEKDEKLIFSYMILKQDKGLPIEVIYRWVRRGNQMSKKDGNIFILEEEHIYSGRMKENRKHGDGEYIIIKKMSNALQKRIRYKGIWKNDIFSKGVIEGEDGSIKEVESGPILSIKSKRGMFGKSERNPTVQLIADQMQKKKSAKQINLRISKESHTSITQKVNGRRSMKPALMTKDQ